MEVLGAVSIIASLAAFTSSSVTIIGQVARSSGTITTLTKELTIIEIILRETENTLRSFRSFSAVPDSIRVCLDFCLQKRKDVLRIIDKIAPDSKDGTRVSFAKKWRMVVMSTLYESEVVGGYNSFRDSVLLLRDLTSEYVRTVKI